MMADILFIAELVLWFHATILGTVRSIQSYREAQIDLMILRKHQINGMACLMAEGTVKMEALRVAVKIILLIVGLLGLLVRLVDLPEIRLIGMLIPIGLIASVYLLTRNTEISLEYRYRATDKALQEVGMSRQEAIDGAAPGGPEGGA